MTESDRGPIDLSVALGLPARLSLAASTIEGLRFIHEPPRVRLRRELEPTLLRPDRLSDGVAYTMIRDVRTAEDDARLRAQSLRFDLTILEARPLGSEYNKTFGHIHPVKPGTDLSYPELYAVLSGSGIVLLEHIDGPEVVDDVLLVEIFSGQYLVVPPGYGHVTINLGPERLILLNAVARTFVSDYSEFTDHHGAAYHLLVGPRGPRTEVSEFYRLVAPARWVVPKELHRLNLSFYEPMYTQMRVANLEFLTRPEAYPDLLAEELYETSQREPVRTLRHSGTV